MSDPQAPILEVEDLSIAFAARAGPVPAVEGFSCTLRPGEALGLVGESGCGKSTAALGIMQDLGPEGVVVGGRIRFRGRDLAELSPRELRRLRGAEMAMVHQEPMAALNPAMRIDRQLMEGAMIHRGASAREARRQALEMIAAVRLPDPERIARAYPHQLSGGQQQRIVIAMALMPRPALLILDEPTTALDVTVEAGIIDLIKGLAAEMGTALLFISHNLGLVLETCERLCVMYAGRAVETGEVRAVFEEMRHPYTQGLFRSIPLPGADKAARPLQPIPGQLPQPHERPPGCAFGPRCAYFQAGRCDAGAIPMAEVSGRPGHETRCLRWAEIDWDAPAPAPRRGAPPAPGEVVLRAEGLRKYYEIDTHGLLGSGERRVVKANEDLGFELREAETLAIVGESGCGKSTLAKVLLGLETASGGTATLGEDDIAHLPVQSRGRKVLGGIQMVFQNPVDTLNPARRVGAQLIRTLEKFGVGRDGRDRERRMLELLDVVKLPRAFADRLPRQLSGGQKQRIGIARAFAGDARVVVADEPVSALDVSVQAAVTELLTEIQRERRTAMIFISHDLAVVRYLADRVLVMYLGHVVEIGTADQIFAPPYHPYTEALLAAAPVPDARVRRRRVVLEGDPPSAIDPPSGCPFQTRCPRKHQVPGDLCERELPPLREIGRGHSFLCHLSEDALNGMEPVIEAPKAAE